MSRFLKNIWPSFFLLFAAMLGNQTTALALENETLLMALPAGFNPKPGFTTRQGAMEMAEYVPIGETVENWSRMITVQIVHGKPKMGTDDFGKNMDKTWVSGCPGADNKKITNASESGYPVSIWFYGCPLSPKAKKPENTFMKFIEGNDSFYILQVAYHREVTMEDVPVAMEFLKKIRVCDTRLPDRPCTVR